MVWLVYVSGSGAHDDKPYAAKRESEHIHALVPADYSRRALYDHLRDWEQELELADASVFFDFPLYRDEERLVQCQFLLASASCGIVLAGGSNVQRDATNALKKAEAAVDAQHVRRLITRARSPRWRRARPGCRPRSGPSPAPASARGRTPRTPRSSPCRGRAAREAQ